MKVLEDFESSLKSCFELNSTDEVSAQSLWESQKAVIRGVLIIYSTSIKKLKLQEVNDLLKEIRWLEQRHKSLLLPAATDQLKDLRAKCQSV